MKKINLAKQLWWLLPLLIAGLILFRAFSGSEHLKEAQKIPNLGNKHITSVIEAHEPYNSNPPTSGPHLGSSVAPWGVSKEIVSDELQVHNLEDGGVIIQYNPDKLNSEEITKLESMISLHQRILVAPRYEMDYIIALTAWNRLLPLEKVDEEKIKAFVSKYAGIDHHVRAPGY